MSDVEFLPAEDDQERAAWSDVAAGVATALRRLPAWHPERPAFETMWRTCREAAGEPLAAARDTATQTAWAAVADAADASSRLPGVSQESRDRLMVIADAATEMAAGTLS